MKDCHAIDICKQYPKGCSEYCIGYIQMKNIYILSNMPKRYQKEMKLTDPGPDLKAFKFLKEFQENVVEKVDEGAGLFLYSERKGNGKTSWACKITNEYFRKVALSNNLKCRGLFVSVPEFLQDLRKEISNPTQHMERMVENIETADMVIWDDIGSEKPSDWVRERLYTYINHRESRGKTQIYTSNISLDELADDRYLGERIASRINGQCHIIEFKGIDRRGDWK